MTRRLMAPAAWDRFRVHKIEVLQEPDAPQRLGVGGANSTIAAWKRGDAPPIEEDGILTAEDVSTLDLGHLVSKLIGL
jgi:hypothetical protein